MGIAQREGLRWRSVCVSASRCGHECLCSRPVHCVFHAHVLQFLVGFRVDIRVRVGG
jgi:hypothetical protein